MSALRVDEDGAGARPRRSPRSDREEHQQPATRRQPGANPRPNAEQSRLSRVPFVLVLIVIFGVGMAGLLALNTSLQGQSFQARALHNRADKLDHRETALNRKAQDLRAPDRLAEQAWKLGLRPNNRHAVLKLPGGKIVGKPGSAGKNPIPGLKPKSEKNKSEKNKSEKNKTEKNKSEKNKTKKNTNTDHKKTQKHSGGSRHDSRRTDSRQGD